MAMTTNTNTNNDMTINKVTETADLELAKMQINEAELTADIERAVGNIGRIKSARAQTLRAHLTEMFQRAKSRFAIVERQNDLKRIAMIIHLYNLGDL